MDIREFGAVGDGVQDDHGAIQAALDGHDGLVTIPEGVYKIGGTLRIPSNTRLEVHPATRLFFADGAGIDSSSFLLTNKNHDQGDQNIHIEGGIWDGNNPGNPRGPDAPKSYTGALINFINVTDLSIRELTVRDSEAYFIRLGEVEDFEVSGIRFEAKNQRPNQDGVHLGGFCKNGIVSDLVGVDGSTNDDLVALNADDALHRAQNLDLKRGPVENIKVENLEVDSCHSFVRLLSVHFPIRDVQVKNVRGGCRCMAINVDACRECRVELFDPDDPAYQDGVGDISGVKIEDFRVYKSSEQDDTPMISLRTNLQDFEVKDFHRDEEKDLNPTAPTILFSDCRASRMTLEGNPDLGIDTIEYSEKIAREALEMGTAGMVRKVFEIGQNGVLSQTQGGFSALSIEPRQVIHTETKKK